MVPNPWGRAVGESYDFDVTKSDKLFDFLLEKGQIKLPDGCGSINPYTLTAKLGPARIDGSGPPERRRAAQPT